MNALSWITEFMMGQNFPIPPAFAVLLDRGTQKQEPFLFSNKEWADEDTEAMNMLYTRRHVQAFARRVGRDGVICLVTADGGDFPKGSVLVLHWDSAPGVEVDESYPSLDAWAKSAAAEMKAWASAT